MKEIKVDDSVIQEAQNLADNVYAPLKNFTNEKDF